MRESLKELNAKCQKPQYKTVGNWMVRKILRPAAVPVTWLLLHTPVTANQVTLASLILGALGIVFFAVPGKEFFLAGALLLQLWYFLDHVDGQIARYRGTACMSGRFFDFVTHHFIHGILWFFPGVYAFQITGQFFFIFWGFAVSAATFMFNMIYDIQYKTFFEKILSAGKLEMTQPSGAGGNSQKPSRESTPKKLFSIVHKLEEIHVAMNILTLTAVLQLLPGFGALDYRFCLFLFYGLTVPALAIVKITYLIKGRKIDAAFDASIKIQE